MRFNCFFCLFLISFSFHIIAQDSVTKASDYIPDYFKLKEREDKVDTAQKIEKKEDKEDIKKEKREEKKEEKKEDKIDNSEKIEVKESKVSEKRVEEAKKPDAVTEATVIFPEDEYEYYKRKNLEQLRAKEQKKKEIVIEEKVPTSKVNETKDQEIPIKEEVKKEEVIAKEEKIISPTKENIEEVPEKKVTEIKSLPPPLIKEKEREKEKRSDFIIFTEKNQKEPPSLKGYDDNSLVTIKPWYSSDDFVPESIEEFYRAIPYFSYSDTGVIKRGKLLLPVKLGDELFGLAHTFFLKNDYKNTLFIYERFIYYNYKVPESAYYIALCNFMMDKIDLAIAYMKYAIEAASEFKYSKSLISDYNYQLGNFYFKNLDYSSALNSYLLSLELNKTNYKNYDAIGLSYFKLGDYQKALDIWKQGLEYGDENSRNNYYWLKERLR